MRNPFATRLTLRQWTVRIVAAAFVVGVIEPLLAQTAPLLAPPTSALKFGWYATQLGGPMYDPDPMKTNLWSMYQFCFGNARKYHMDKFHVSLAHLSNDPQCVRADGKAPKIIPRRPGCVSVQLTADCVAEPADIPPEVDPKKLTLAWTKAFAAASIAAPSDFIDFQDEQPEKLLRFSIRVSSSLQILPSRASIEQGDAGGTVQPGTITGAKYLLVGSAQAMPGTGIQVFARLIVVETAVIVGAAKGNSPDFSERGLESDVQSALASLETHNSIGWPRGH